MKITKWAACIVCVSISFSCKDNSTSPGNPPPARALSLSANAATGTAPCNIIFTGTFNDYTDTTTMRTPDMFIIGGPGLTVIPYSLSGYPPLQAKRTYSDTVYFPSAGSYSIHMVLETTAQALSSDTITVTIH